MIKHCTKCHGFAWWDGDFCCTKRMAIIEGAPNGKFWAILPDAFDANVCEDYDFNEKYNYDVHEYYPQYINFLKEIINKEHSNEKLSDDELLTKYGYKHYDKTHNNS